MLTRHIWIALGWLTTLLGIIGTVVPLLPTTPFLLLAALAFERGSPVLHQHLLSHPRLGRYIHQWREYGGIERPLKYCALGLMLASLVLSLLMALPGWIVITQLLIFTAVGTFVMMRPNAPPD